MKHPGFSFGLPFLLETADVVSAVELAQQAGLSFVELNSNFPQCTMDKLAALPLKSLMEQTGIFFTLHVDDRFDPFDFNPLVREAYVTTMEQALHLANKVGIPVINMHIPRGNIVTLPSRRHYLYEDFPEEFSNTVTAFARRCEKTGSPARIAIENTEVWADYELQAINSLLASPSFGLCLDTGHDHATGNQDLAFLTRHKDRLIHMHLHDGWDQTNHQALGSGEIPLKDRLSLALDAGATVVLEVKTKEALLTSVRYLKEQGWLG